MRRKILPIVVLIAVAGQACSHAGFLSKRPRSNRERLDRQIKNNYDLPMVLNDEVKRWIRYFQNDYQGRFSLYLSRSGRYETFMRQILREEGLPEDLVYVALIESGFSNFAYSRARAVGPWQFIHSTGRVYGLKLNSWVDERRDPEKSTRAAAHYLKKLYRDFGDWYLAMAAYNAGEGRIQRAMHRSRRNNFWAIASTNHIRPETKNYVPKFIAAALIAKNPSRFGFRHIRYEEPLTYDVVRVKGPLDLEVAAELAGVDFLELKGLNPELTLGMTPHGNYALKIPSGRAAGFKLAYAKLPPQGRVRYVYHTVKRGDSVWKISKRYGVSQHSLIAANNFSSRQARFLRPGSRLVIPKKTYAKGKTPLLLAYNDQPGSQPNKKIDGVEYLIRKDFGENGKEKEVVTEAEAAPRTAKSEHLLIDPKGMEKAGLPEIEEVDLKQDHRLQTIDHRPEEETNVKESVIVIPAAHAAAPKPETYIIKRGDNLWKIARRHSVSVTKLKEWNKITNPSLIRPGKTLIVASPLGL